MKCRIRMRQIETIEWEVESDRPLTIVEAMRAVEGAGHVEGVTLVTQLGVVGESLTETMGFEVVEE